MRVICWVFRGFQDNTDKIQINSDTRSRKVLYFSKSIFLSFLFSLYSCLIHTHTCKSLIYLNKINNMQIEELKSCPFSEVITFWVLHVYFFWFRHLVLLSLFLTVYMMYQICWYFTESWEQFRINGRVDVIDGSNSDPEKLQVMLDLFF